MRIFVLRLEHKDYGAGSYNYRAIVMADNEDEAIKQGFSFKGIEGVDIIREIKGDELKKLMYS